MLEHLCNAVADAMTKASPLWPDANDTPKLRFMAETVVDALGLEQVGWHYRFSTGIEGLSLDEPQATSETGPFESCEPVYTVAASGSSTAPPIPTRLMRKP